MSLVIPGRSPRPQRGALFPWSMSVTPKGWWRASSIPQALGSAVASWPDLIGSCGALAQGTAAKQPVLTANQVNGRPAVVFDGVDDMIASPTFTAISQPLCYLAVISPAALPTGSNLVMPIASSGASGSRLELWLWASYSAWFITATETGSGLSLIGQWTTGPRKIAAVFNGASSRLVVGTTDVSGNDQGTNQLTQVRLGAQNALSAYPFSGAIAEVVLCTGTPTAADLVAWNTYVAQEYSL